MINLSMFIATVIVLVCVLLSDATKVAKQAEESLDLYYNETSEETDGNGFNNQIGFNEQINSAKHRSADPIIAKLSSTNDPIATKSSATLESQAKGRQGVARSCVHHIPLSEKPLYFWEQVNSTGWPYRFVGKDNTSTTVDYIEDEASKNTTTVVVFVKFHKVAGTMMACDILKHLQQSRANDNFYLCASHFCSLSVARSFRRFVSEPGFYQSNHMIRMQKRNALLAGTTEWIGPGGRHPIVFPTLSSGQLQSSLNIKFMTILRHPIERIRSKYYFRREGWCKKKKEGCLATKLTFLEWLNYYEHRNSTTDEIEVCCEYTKILGGTSTSVDEALRALELFDVLAFTEQYDESSSEVAEALGLLDYNETTVSMRNNTSAKKRWSAEERAVAERITAGDIVVYNTALSMMMTGHI